MIICAFFFLLTLALGRQWQTTPVLLPGKSHGQMSLVGCSPGGREESDMTEWLHFHALEKQTATHSSVLSWRIPGKGEPGGLPSLGSHRVGHNWKGLSSSSNSSSSRQENEGEAIGFSLDKAIGERGRETFHFKNGILKTIQLFNNNRLLSIYYVSDTEILT